MTSPCTNGSVSPARHRTWEGARLIIANPMHPRLQVLDNVDDPDGDNQLSLQQPHMLNLGLDIDVIAPHCRCAGSISLFTHTLFLLLMIPIET